MKQYELFTNILFINIQTWPALNPVLHIKYLENAIALQKIKSLLSIDEEYTKTASLMLMAGCVSEKEVKVLDDTGKSICPGKVCNNL